MSKISDSLKQVNTELRASIQAEHDQVKVKLDELLAKIDELSNTPDAEFDAVLADTRSIATEIQAIFE